MLLSTDNLYFILPIYDNEPEQATEAGVLFSPN